MGKLKFLKRHGNLLAIVFLSAFLLVLNSCNDSSKSSETKDSTSTENKMNEIKMDTTHPMPHDSTDTTKSDQPPPPK